MSLYERNIVTNTNLKYADSSSDYHAIAMLQNLKNKYYKISNFFRILDVQSAGLK